MSNRGWIVSAVTAAAIIVPQQLAHESRNATESSPPAWWDSMWAADSTPALTAPHTPPGPSYEPGRFAQTTAVPPPTAVTPPMVAERSLAEIFRFNITPESVVRQWPQVWTRFGEGGLSGLRVTLMSGTRPTDLTGSLTYYFDREHILQRITFAGSCGDPSELIFHLQQSYPLQPMPTLGGYQYAARDRDGRITSGLVIRYAPIIQQSEQYRRLELDLELNRSPGGSLSERFQTWFEEPPAEKGPRQDPAVRQKEPESKTGEKKTDPPKRGSQGPRGRPLDELLPHSG